MKHIMLAAVASIALALPAMAQSNHTNTMQPDNQAAMQSQAKNRQQNRIDPSQLSTQQIRQIQMSLNKKGFDAKHADGKWGPETEAALKNFQQKQNIKGNGQLDRQTLAAFGINESGQSREGSATTGSGSNENRMNQPSQNPGAMNSGENGQSSPSMNSGGHSGGQTGE